MITIKYSGPVDFDVEFEHVVKYDVINLSAMIGYQFFLHSFSCNVVDGKPTGKLRFSVRPPIGDPFAGLVAHFLHEEQQ